MSEPRYPTDDGAQDEDGDLAQLRVFLGEAAVLWVRKYGLDGWPGEYSTCQNRFLYEAENAWSEAAQAAYEALPPPPPPLPSSGFHLYRLWSPTDRLLYIGVSTKLRRRIGSHRRRWGDLIARITWEAHDDAESMLAAESLAIQNEMPALNKSQVG